MNTKILLVFLLLFLVGCSTNNETNLIEEDEVILDNKTIIVAFGDSLTEGLGVDRDLAYPAQLETRLLQKGYSVKVYNSGLSGETSSGALQRVNWVLSLNPDIVILGIGANDAIRGINLDITKQNIIDIIDKLEESNVKVVLSGQEIYENLGSDYVGKFKELYPQVASEKNVTLIPFFLEGVAANSSLNNNDQIHPNELGYSIIVENNILPVIEPMLR